MTKHLTNRLARIEGQVAALKRCVASTPSDCEENIRQLKTITQSLKRFGEVYIVEQMQNCIDTKSKRKVKKEIAKLMELLINI